MAIKRVLVANRGEIARRIFRTCREMGISTVAVYSDADATEPHALEADEAIHLPGSEARETYLNVKAILAAAETSGADALHPGYGFLAENSAFAEAVIRSGVTWIGPSPEAIGIMGSKLASKDLMIRAGVPTLHGIDLAGLSAVKSAAVSIGFPILVKASAGGGGKGMRVVSDPDDLLEAIESAKREAASAFGDKSVFLERYLPAPRHIEIQVFADSHGNVVSLFERECSIQRRHQKIIEESPSIAIDEKTRNAMGKAAIKAAKAVDYLGAGTVEFLFQDDEFHFLEMNTRLQVEHPVTEAVTGLDLVRLQIQVADGEPLPPEALAPTMTGHAIEARIYAEDPTNDFLPATGSFRRFEFEADAEVRIDSGIESGSEVSVFYDPMLAKVIAHADSRTGAALKLAAALRSARVHGSPTNLSLLVRILESEQFLKGETDTRFLERHDIAAMAAPLLDKYEEYLAAVAAALADQAERRSEATVLDSIPSGFRNSRSQPQRVAFKGFHGEYEVGYTIGPNGVAIEGLKSFDLSRCTPDRVSFHIGEASYEFSVSRDGDRRDIDCATGPVELEVVPRFPQPSQVDDEGSLHAPMPGKILRIDVMPGDVVKEGQVLLVLEAMKMEHALKAPHGGTIAEVDCGAGDQVEAGEVLVIVGDPPAHALPST